MRYKKERIARQTGRFYLFNQSAESPVSSAAGMNARGKEVGEPIG